MGIQSTKKKGKTGFTLIEVALFLAISGAILMFILSGTSNSLAQQRYNDTVQDIYSFLQSQYSSVISPQNTSDLSTNPGFSDRAIYGKLIVIDKDEVSGSGGSVINSWTVVGDIVKKADIDKDFGSLNLKVRCDERASYSIQWGNKIETTASDHKKLSVSIAILRSPKNGTIITFKNEGVRMTPGSCSASDEKDFFTAGTFTTSFKAGLETDICVATEDNVYGGKRRNIRIMNANGINSINLIPLDDAGENRC